MEKYANATLDTLSVGAIGTGITLVAGSKLTEGVILIVAGIVISVLKYHLRKD